MEEVHTCFDVRYWTEVLCCTIPTQMSDLEVKAVKMTHMSDLEVKEVKVTDLEKNYIKVFGLSF